MSAENPDQQPNVNIGDRVRILEIPGDLTDGLPWRDVRAIRLQVGKVLEVEGFGEDGTLELEFLCGLCGPADYHTHTIWLAARCVEVVR